VWTLPPAEQKGVIARTIVGLCLGLCGADELDGHQLVSLLLEAGDDLAYLRYASD
jgi:hypothetical protein